MKLQLLLASVLMGLLLVGCTQNSPSTQSSALEVKGSDTELQMFSALAEEFMKENPQVRVTVTGGGSGTGIAALINGEIDVADSSRAMKDEELKQARANRVEPLEFIIARDGLAVVVHPSNGVSELTLGQLADIYAGKITNWKNVGGADKAITLYGRQTTSGTYVFFRDTVLKADYSPSMRNMEGTAAIVDAVAVDETGIGYVGLGYLNQRVKPVSLEGKMPTDESAVANGVYPLTRPLYQYYNALSKKSGVAKQLLLFELTPRGQEVVKQSGFLAISSGDASKNQQSLGKLG